MKRRGKILRDTASGPGLLMLEGQQYRFALDGVWKSEQAPRPGLGVDVALDAQGDVQSITVVPHAQLEREQAEADLARQKGVSAPSSLLDRIGLPHLFALGFLVVSWLFLTAATIQLPFPGKLEFTFWQMLGLLDTGKLPEFLDGRGDPHVGLYNLAAILALAGPFLHRFWKTRRAGMAGLLPLVFMIAVGIACRRDFENVKSVSLGAGAYVSITLCIYFAIAAIRGLAVPGSWAAQQPTSTQRKAA